jgi:hypothetical protein
MTRGASHGHLRYIVHAGPFVEVGGVQENADGSLRAAPWPKTCLAQAMVVIWVGASVQTLGWRGECPQADTDEGRSWTDAEQG